MKIYLEIPNLVNIGGRGIGRFLWRPKYVLFLPAILNHHKRQAVRIANEVKKLRERSTVLLSMKIICLVILSTHLHLCYSSDLFQVFQSKVYSSLLFHSCHVSYPSRWFLCGIKSTRLHGIIFQNSVMFLITLFCKSADSNPGVVRGKKRTEDVELVWMYRVLGDAPHRSIGGAEYAVCN
jgi:hypothetical protein